MKTNNNHKFKIESDVPMPVKTRIYDAFKEMKIGDSFFAPSSELSEESVRFGACYFGRRNKEFKLSVRKVDGGVRVWRIKKI